MSRFIAQITLVPLCLMGLIAPAHGFFFSASGPDPSLETTRALAAELKDRTGTVWNEIDKHVDQLLKYHHALQQLTPEQANALTEQDLAKQMELHVQWAKKFTELRDFLGEEYGLFIEKVKTAEMKQNFKDAVVKHYDGAFRDAARDNMYPYLNGMENINQSLFDTYKMISRMRFPQNSSGSKPEDLNAERLNLLKGAISEETIEKIKAHRRAFLDFLTGFQFNPLDDNAVFKAAMNFFARDEKLSSELRDNFTKTYFKDDAYKAEANMKFYTSNALNTQLPGALPKASAETLIKYAEYDIEVLKRLAYGSTGDNTKSCLIFAEAKEFVGVDFNQILNNFYYQEAPWSVTGLFKAANDVVASSMTAPADFSAGREQAEQLLDLGKKSALASVKKNTLFKKLTQKNKFSPRRFCFLRYTVLEELLKLPSPAREDTLRLIYLEDLEKRMKNIQAAAGKK